MGGPQLIFQASPYPTSIVAEKPESLKILADTLLIPLYATLLSADVLFLHGVSESRWFKRIVNKFRGIDSADQSAYEEVEEDHTNSSLRQRFHEHIASHGGALAFTLGVIRVLGGIPLLGLNLHLFFLEHQQEHSSHLEIPGWIDAALIITFAYTLLLSFAYIITRPPAYSRFSLASHVNFVLFVAWAVYFARDILPLATYNVQPADIAQGNLLWGILGTLTVVGVIIPLITPRRYIPSDPEYILPPTTEQTASPWSYYFFSYLTPLVIKANRVEHLPLADLPPLADFDAATPLTKKAFPLLDPHDFSTRSEKRSFTQKVADKLKLGRHTRFLFSMLYVFRREYAQIIFYQTLQAFATIASPLVVNNLLKYLNARSQTGQPVVHILSSGSTSPFSAWTYFTSFIDVSQTSQDSPILIKPWVWVLLMFLAPVTRAVLDNQYFVAYTGARVRSDAILTQLVLSHALRVRVVAETGDNAKGQGDGLSREPSSSSSGPETPAEPAVAVATTEVPLGLDPEGDPDAIAHVETTGTEQIVGENAESETNVSINSSTAASTTNASTTASTLVASSGSKDGKGDKSTDAAQNLVGKMNNLISTDLNNIGTGGEITQVFYFGPLMILVSTAFLYTVLGWSAFVGLGLTILLLPVPIQTAKLLSNASKEVLKRSDGRVSTVTESISVIRMVKLFAWEGLIGKRIASKREEEIAWIWKRKILQLLTFSINFTIPAFTMVATYGTYTLIMKRQLDAATVFSSMSAFFILRGQISRTFYFVPQIVQGKVSLDRICDFLYETELLDQYAASDETESTTDSPVVIESAVPDTDIIGFNAASFAWSNADAQAFIDGTLTPSKRRFRLRIDDELVFKRGKINLIVGVTGAGKTSLLMALLGEMHFIRSGPNSWFNLPREKGVAYVAQESWVLNETIKDNILFGAPYDEERYNKVIKQCGLERDLSLFKAGDLTEVGEKGLTLSGGQKARVTLARAIYSSAEILLLDDVLAALDVHTAKWIVDKCLMGDLVRGRTIILVTHNVSLTSSIADFVVSLGSDGRILSRGTISDALAKDKKLRHAVAHEKKEVERAEEAEAQAPEEDKTEAAGKLVLEEETAVGHLSFSSMMLYFKALGGNHVALFWFLLIFMTILECSIEVVQPWFLGYWATQYEEHPGQVNAAFYMGGYSLLAVAMIVIFFAAQAILTWGTLSASKVLHGQLMESVLGTTMRWLDKTPTSRIITRCTQDIQSIDTAIPGLLSGLNEVTALLLVRYVTVLIMVPRFGPLGVVVILAGAALGQIYIRAQLSVKRELSKAKAPVMAHFGAAVEGITSIRAYGAQDRFKYISTIKINEYTRASRANYDLSRWVGVRIDALGATFATALAAWFVYGSSALNASDSGFSLSMAVSVGNLVLQWVRMLNEFEVTGNSIERLHQYLEIEHEPKPTEGGSPPAYWPSSGDLRVEGLSARYSEDGPRVLHDLSFHVKSGERVGVVGRTGSGKSSLTLSLLRCINVEGNVYYDGIPITSLNLDALRSQVTIIPQMPELLSGTLRSNLDPFEQHDDATLNAALRSAGLNSLQNETDENRLTLDSAIARGGTNLSVGQRQIIALARAMVRDSKLLILDEATSAIDYETDSVIQASLRNELKKDVTVLTIAHRLQTIMDSDKIMVLDAGRVIEFDSPYELLKNEDGLLRSLVDESGDREALYAAAATKAKA